MAQLTLRTLLAYIDDTLEPAMARQLGTKVAESELAQELIERIKKVTRRRRLQAPPATGPDAEVSDPNTVAEYLSDTLDSDHVTRLEQTCLESDVHLAEVAACHQILTILLTEPVRVPPRARQRMYKLVKPPASVPGRRPNKALPVGGLPPRPSDRVDHDDADAALLLGMSRYGSGGTLGRIGLVAAALALTVMLGFAVFMALPGRPADPPDTSPAEYAAVTPTTRTPATPTPTPGPAPTPTPVPTPTPPAPPEDLSGLEVAPPPAEVGANKPAPPEPGPMAKPPEKVGELVNAPAPPRADRVPIAKVTEPNVIVVSRADDAATWTRADAAGEPGVMSSDQVACLPGYKADVQLETGVHVYLWGNVPELLPARLLESRVRFHPPEPKADGKGAEFDADLTLLAGRVYLSTTKPSGGRVRVRFAGEVWDVTLPDAKAEVMVEVISAYDPGQPFVRDGGQRPRAEARLAVINGGAALAAGGGKPEPLAPQTVVTWDNKTGKRSAPKPVEKGNAYFDKFLLVGSDSGQVVQKALTDMVTRLDERKVVKLMVAELLTEPPVAARVVTTQLAVYAQTALIHPTTAADDLKPLVDILTDEVRGYARLAVVNALAGWLAQDPGNTALLGRQLDAKLTRDGEADTILRLFRGYVPAANPDPAALDQLVEFLNSPSVAVRELAQWNLINFVDPAAARTPGMVTDVAIKGPAHDKYVKAWKARIEEVKQAPPKK